MIKGKCHYGNWKVHSLPKAEAFDPGYPLASPEVLLQHWIARLHPWRI